MNKYAIFLLVPTIVLSGCGGSSDSVETLTGVFLDSTVSGISYRTETINGQTNSLGQFNFIEGESVTFHIGIMDFPTVLARDIITPVSMSPSASIEDNAAINIARLLQTLDTDGDPNNGISIPESASSVAIPIDFSAAPNDFSQNSDVVNLIANSGGGRVELLDASTATAHLSNTLLFQSEIDVGGVEIVGGMPEIIGSDGATMVGVNGTWRSYLGADGMIVTQVLEEGVITLEKKLSWRINEEQIWCQIDFVSEQEVCEPSIRIIRKSDNVYLYFVNGALLEGVTFNLERGNPHNL